MKNFAGVGRKRPQLNIAIKNLLLDPQNPRLPSEVQGKSQNEINKALFKYFDTEELAFSMAENGYFDEEPLVAIPLKLPSEFDGLNYRELKVSNEYHKFIEDPNTKFVVVEGNRRLSTIRLLLDDQLRSEFKIRTFPNLRAEIKDDLQIVPVIIYPNRKEVLPYLGVRHISGIKKWEPYAKARYVANMVSQGHSIEDIQKQVGDRSNSARKIYLSYQLIELIKDEFDLDTKEAENNFSFLMLATGQGGIKEYLGIERKIQDVDLWNPIPSSNIDKLKDVFSWLFGEAERNILPAIRESRDITNKLAPILRNKVSTEYLKSTRDINTAYELSDGEDELLKTNLLKANRLLTISLGLINDDNKGMIREDIDKIKSMVEKFEILIQ